MYREYYRPAMVILLLVVVIMSLALMLSLPSERAVSAESIRSRLDSLSADPGDPASLRQQACELAGVLFDDPAQRQTFADETLDTWLASRDVDLLLVYNTGGFGGSTMADDPEWPGILEGMKSELAASGCKSAIVEHRRGQDGFVNFLKEVEDVRHDYRGKSAVLAAKMAFLTKYHPHLRVIMTGRCFGGIMCSEAMKLTIRNLRLYSIEASLPFWYTHPELERTLVIEDNGVEPDIVHSEGVWRFLWNLAKANFGRLPSGRQYEGGSFRAIRWYLKAPGHLYTWEQPAVRSRVLAFLREQNLVCGEQADLVEE